MSTDGRHRLVMFAMALAVLVAACGDDDGGSTVATSALPALQPLHATRGQQPGIFDAAGRQVLLRGMNLNALGDYYQANPQYPSVIPLRIPTSHAWRATASTSCD